MGEEAMNNKKFLVLCVLIAACVFIGYSALKMVSKAVTRKKIQCVTDVTWPAGTKELEWMFAGIQGSWVRVHLHNPIGFSCDNNKFHRFNPNYLKPYDLSAMDECWDRQNRLWRDGGSLRLFDGMENPPKTGTNLLFATNFSEAFSNDVPWAIVYDEGIRQMWIFIQ